MKKTKLLKDGIIYDAKKLLADVRKMVSEAKTNENFEIMQLGIPQKGVSRVQGAEKNYPP